MACTRNTKVANVATTFTQSKAILLLGAYMVIHKYGRPSISTKRNKNGKWDTVGNWELLIFSAKQLEPSTRVAFIGRRGVMIRTDDNKTYPDLKFLIEVKSRIRHVYNQG